MENLTLVTPSILFSAISLIMLAYTNRFLAYAALIRELSAKHAKNPSQVTHKQIKNLRHRLHMTRAMQTLGIFSLFLCVLCTFFIYIDLQTIAVWSFAVALIALSISLAISIAEIQISSNALEIHLDNIDDI